jgi:hypothetical protein
MTGQKRLRVRNRAVLDAAAGAAAGCVARFVVGPLDVLKIRFQAGICSATTVASQLVMKHTRLLAVYVGAMSRCLMMAWLGGPLCKTNCVCKLISKRSLT